MNLLKSFIVALAITFFANIGLVAQTARVQVIHNSADNAAGEVDVWLNNILLLDNFGFREATPFVDAPAGVPVTISIQPSSSTDTVGALAKFTYTLEAGKKYVIVANGIVIPTGYNPVKPFNLYVYDMGREAAADKMKTDVLVFHGSTDAPTVDVVETLVGAGTVVNNLAYGQFAGYLELPNADFRLEIRDESGMTTVVSYDAPLKTLELAGQSLVVIASGFLNPAANNGGAGFGLFAVLANGAVVELPLSNTASINDLNEIGTIIENYPNPFNAELSINLNIEQSGFIQLDIVDVFGNVVSKVANQNLAAGNYSFSIDANALNSGIYYLRALSQGKSGVSKLVKY